MIDLRQEYEKKLHRQGKFIHTFKLMYDNFIDRPEIVDLIKSPKIAVKIRPSIYNLKTSN